MKKLFLFIYKHWRWTLTIVTLLLVAAAIRSLSVAVKSEDGLMGISIESDGRIDLTPEQITSIRRIGKWEFLSMQMEEIVDTTHKRFLLPDEHLIRIYHGTIRLGIDMGRLPSDWFRSQGDTAILHLPHIQQLNKKFIDETQTQTFYETGSWSARAREQMYRRAELQMKKRLSASNAYEQAERNGREQVSALMRNFGFQTAVVTFGE